MRMADRSVIVTGGAGSMGSAQARLFSKEGASVCVADFNLKGAQAVASEIGEGGGDAIAVELDVRDSVAWGDAVSNTEREFGKVDTLCNIAGANFRVSFDDQTEEMWRTIIDTNLSAYFLGTKAVIPAMRRAGKGGHHQHRFARFDPAGRGKSGLRGQQDRTGRTDAKHRVGVCEGQHPVRSDLARPCGHQLPAGKQRAQPER